MLRLSRPTTRLRRVFANALGLELWCAFLSGAYARSFPAYFYGENPAARILSMRTAPRWSRSFLSGVQPSLFDRGGCRRRASSSLVLSGKGELCSWLEPEWLVCGVQTKTRPTVDVPEGVEGADARGDAELHQYIRDELSVDNGSQLPWFPRGDPTCCSGRMQKLCCA
jgi:hypothetical protein